MLKLAGVLLTCSALGSGFGITLAVLEEKSLKGIEFCGFIGTTFGFLFGVFILIAGVMMVAFP